MLGHPSGVWHPKCGPECNGLICSAGSRKPLRGKLIIRHRPERMQTGMKTVSGYCLYLYRRSMARNSVAAFSEAVQANRER